MKTSRLLMYAVGGIIAGLLLENGTLRLRQMADSKARELKKKANKKVDKALHRN